MRRGDRGCAGAGGRARRVNRGWLAAAGLVAGCGRFGFAPRPQADAHVAVDGASYDVSPMNCPAFAVFCDDFESGDLSRWADMDEAGNGSVTVTSSMAHSGTFALHGVGPAAMAGGTAGNVLRPNAIVSGPIAIREWMYAPQPMIGFDAVLQLGLPSTGYLLVAGDSVGNWVVDEDVDLNIYDNYSSDPAPVGVWTCIELDFNYPPSGHFQLFVNDVSEVDVLSQDPAPAYTEISVGVIRAEPAGWDVFVDDVVVAQQHIGC